MYRVGDKESDNFYMYKFRTKKQCRQPNNCNNTHSLVTWRRVPKQGRNGLFNYIPKPCPGWKKHQKCVLQDSCPQAHGFLEIIYHPLLYRTKMCESNQKSGVCRKYGVHCAKAHHPTEIRNLAKIYGTNWKKHYNLNLRGSATKSINKSASRFDKFHGLKHAGSCESEIILKYLEGFPSELSNSLRNISLKKKQGRVGITRNMKQYHTKESASLLSPLPLLGLCNDVDDLMRNMLLDEVSHYTELYSKKSVMSDNKLSKCINESSCRPSTAESISTTTTMMDSSSSFSNIDASSSTQSSETAETNGLPIKSETDNWPWNVDNSEYIFMDCELDGIWGR